MVQYTTSVKGKIVTHRYTRYNTGEDPHEDPHNSLGKTTLEDSLATQDVDTVVTTRYTRETSVVLADRNVQNVGN